MRLDVIFGMLFLAAAGAAHAGPGLECCACTPMMSPTSPTQAFFCIGPATITDVTSADERCSHIPNSAFGCESASGGSCAIQLLEEDDVACPGAAAPAAGRPALLGLVGILGLIGALSLRLRPRRSA